MTHWFDDTLHSSRMSQIFASEHVSNRRLVLKIELRTCSYQMHTVHTYARTYVYTYVRTYMYVRTYTYFAFPFAKRSTYVLHAAIPQVEQNPPALLSWRASLAPVSLPHNVLSRRSHAT